MSITKKKNAKTQPVKLSHREQKELEAALKRAKRDDGIPRTAQQSIPFQRMFPDGICRVTDRYYTKTIQFQDINYQLAQQEDKTAIFEEWCSFLNFFDSSIHFELSFMNMSTDADAFEKSIRIPYQNDGFDDVRAEYGMMLRQQLQKGNNGLTKSKYLTFGIDADTMKQAKPRLDHIEVDLMNNFHRLGVSAKLLNGKERLQLMHSMFHMGDGEKFRFDWKQLPASGLSVKDYIAPTSFAFPGSRIFRMGSLYGAMSYLQITASDISDQLLKDFLDMDSSEIVTMHIQSVDQNKAIKQISHQAALNHGHQTWDAYYAGGSGDSITITEEESVSICYVTLDSSDFESILRSRLTDKQLEMYDIYQITKGNRIMFGSPVDMNWHSNILYGYGYQCSGNTISEDRIP